MKQIFAITILTTLLSACGGGNEPETYQDPKNATAICNDGTYSYSQTRSGTCSGHGGVRTWLKNVS